MTDVTQARGFAVRGLNHFAWRCRDAEETRRFYEDVLGLPLAHVIRADHVPSTGEYNPYCHVFFRMGDGSFVAFFDLGDGIAPEPSANTPSWVNHLALEVGSEAELLAAKARLEAAGVPVLGVTDHEIIRSIYVFDPNGLRVELTCWAVDEAHMQAEAAHAHAALAEWQRDKRRRAGAAE